MNNGVSWQEIPPVHRDRIGIVSVISTLLLAVALFICVGLLSHAQSEATKLRDQVAVATDEQTCRDKFASEDARLAGIGQVTFRAQLVATAVHDDNWLLHLTEYNVVLTNAQLKASDARTASVDICHLDPTAYPIPVKLPDFPTPK